MIDWHDWSAETFERAKKEQKPIVLDISASWCHWCHVLDDTTWNDLEVAQEINSKFIAIKVDTDRRPDVNDRYNQGGWPSVVFMSATGAILYGGTYIYPQDMKAIIPQMLDHFNKHKEDLTKEFQIPTIELREAKHKIKTEAVEAVIDSAVTHADLNFGGFGTQPKMAIPGILDLLLSKYDKTKDDRYKRIVTITLDGMAGLLDKVDGGFFRYSLTQDWSIPHYEKMLDVNALILRDYLHGFKITGDKKYKDIAVKAVSYILGNLSDERGPFYGSQDANEAYYKLDASKRKKIQPPTIDKTFYTETNCLMISTFLEASKVLDNQQLKETALRALDFLIDNCYEQIKGMCHYYDTKPHLFGQFFDNVNMIRACLDAYDTTKDQKYLQLAEKITEFINKRFKEGSGYLDRATKGDEFGHLKIKNKDLYQNSVAAMCLMDLYSITKKEEYKKDAEEALNFFMDKFEHYGPHAAQYAVAIDQYFSQRPSS